MTIRRQALFLLSILPLLSLSACNTIKGLNSANPMQPPVTYTATGAIAGAGVGAGLGTLTGSHTASIVVGSLVGGSIGYYFASERAAAANILKAGGAVYSIGERVTIAVPTYKLFETNTDRFLPRAEPVLDSIAAILKRYPDDDVIISGNTNGFGLSHTQKVLSLNQAKQIAGFLWAQGINSFAEDISHEQEGRHLSYVGYADRFPIANDITATGIEANYRIQITAYPSKDRLKRNLKHVSSNIASMDEANNNVPESGLSKNYQPIVPKDVDNLPPSPEVMQTLEDQFQTLDQQAAAEAATAPQATKQTPTQPAPADNKGENSAYLPTYSYKGD